MRKLMVALMCLVLFAAAAMPISARTHRHHRRTSHSYTSSRRAYYDYNRPYHRTFWQKHRDKLTTAAGAGAGALIGGIAGGKKGAGIGALAGGGGSALYTYKIRKRSRRY
jgi:ABC-type sulfate transport system substrate-binding protein